MMAWAPRRISQVQARARPAVRTLLMGSGLSGKHSLSFEVLEPQLVFVLFYWGL